MKAQLATEIDISQLPKYIDNDNWWMEEKVDGIRLLLWKVGNQIGLCNRDGEPSTKVHPRVFADVLQYNGGFVFDGEWVNDQYIVFDVLEDTGRMLEAGQISQPFARRRGVLETLMSINGWPACMTLIPCAKTTEEKALLALNVIRNNHEGVMLKRRSSLYHPGDRSSDWLKAKLTHTVDAVVTRVGIDGKNNCELALWAFNDDPQLRTLVPIGTCSLNGKARVTPGMVIEARYLTASDGNKIIQPRLLRVRDDKHPDQCGMEQLVHSEKTLLHW